MDNAQLMKGVLEGCVLAVIARGETYGYEILGILDSAGLSDLGGKAHCLPESKIAARAGAQVLFDHGRGHCAACGIPRALRCHDEKRKPDLHGRRERT